MKITVAIDSFKGSLSSAEAGNAAAKGVLMALPDAEVRVFPIADGGEGTVDSLVTGMHGEYKYLCVHDPLMRPIRAKYGKVGDTAVIEIASAAGLCLVEKELRDPMVTTTYGVGELIKGAISSGCRDFLIGLGGSATNDGGVGMLTALGYEFFDKNGNKIGSGASELAEICSICEDNALPELKECVFRIASDVSNPLCGQNGCSVFFSPQKGAKGSDIPTMDKALMNFALKTKEKHPFAEMDMPGAGAAGGLGFAFAAYLNGIIGSGIGHVIRCLHIEEEIASSDLVITGEGRIDAQTVMGKAPIGIASVAKKYGKTAVAFCGSLGNGAEECNLHGIDALFPILRTPCTLSEAMDKANASKNMTSAVYQAMLLYSAAGNK